jgi:hypothetical protein
MLTVVNLLSGSAGINFGTSSLSTLYYSKPEGQSTTCLHVGERKGKGYSLFLNNIYPALGKAKFELLKNHERARGYLLIFAYHEYSVEIFLSLLACYDLRLE